jgi:hypothetical protein
LFFLWRFSDLAFTPNFDCPHSRCALRALVRAHSLDHGELKPDPMDICAVREFVTSRMVVHRHGSWPPAAPDGFRLQMFVPDSRYRFSLIWADSWGTVRSSTDSLAFHCCSCKRGQNPCIHTILEIVARLRTKQNITELEWRCGVGPDISIIEALPFQTLRQEQRQLLKTAYVSLGLFSPFPFRSHSFHLKIQSYSTCTDNYSLLFIIFSGNSLVQP